MPGPGDLALICTNLRTMNGTRPVFTDDSSSFFVFALSFIRFVEIPPASQLEAGLDVETLEARTFAGPPDRGRAAAPPRPSGPPPSGPATPVGRRRRSRQRSRARDRRGFPEARPGHLSSSSGPMRRGGPSSRGAEGADDRPCKGPVLDSPRMSGNLVIVESPAKAKTIERYLGPGYPVLASYGHVRDLPEKLGKDQLGVDVEHDFAPELRDRRRPAQAGRRDREGRQEGRPVYLATDLDREGEAIAWHVAEAAELAPGEDAPRHLQRDHRGARSATRSPTRARSTSTSSTPSRRGGSSTAWSATRLSPLLWRKVRSGLSAGRVQSVAVRLVVDREREIRAFTAREYWTLEAILAGAETDAVQPPSSSGSTARSRRSATRRPPSAMRDAICARAGRSSRRSRSRRSKRSPAPPFTTSTLQQEASRKLGFCPKRTMSVAQRLYEGVETAEGQVGLITYMRTDSVALSGQAMGEARVGRSPSATASATRCPRAGRLQDQDAQRPGGPRGHPADVVRARPRRRSATPAARRGPPLPADLAARPRQPDDGEGARDHDGRARRPDRYELRAIGHPDRLRRLRRRLHRGPATTSPRRRSGPCRPSAEGDATTVESVERRPSTSPSRRRATPRRPSSRRSRSTASAGRPPTPRRSRRSSIGATSG